MSFQTNMQLNDTEKMNDSEEVESLIDSMADETDSKISKLCNTVKEKTNKILDAIKDLSDWYGGNVTPYL